MRRSEDGRFWIKPRELNEDNLFNVGLTEEYAAKLGVFWTFTTKADLKKIIVGQPFISYESSKKLGTLRSPVQGTIVDWPVSTLLDMPEKINHEVILFTVRTER